MKSIWNIFLSCAVLAARAQDIDSAYSFSTSYGEDEAYALYAGADVGLGRSSRVQLNLGYTRSPQELADLSVYRGSVGFDHDFDPLGFTIGYEYWGDRDRIESHGLRGSIYLHGEPGRLSLIYERRRITLDFDVPLGARAFVNNSRTANSDGFGLSARATGERIDVYAHGMHYDYDAKLNRLATLVDLSRVPPAQRPAVIERLNFIIANLGRLNASTLTLASSLLDYSAAAGIDVRIGDHVLNLELARDVAATDDVALNSASFGFVHAVGERFDIEYRVGVAQGEENNSSLYGGLTLFWYR